MISVLVCDDTPGLPEVWASSIQEASGNLATAKALPQVELVQTIEGLRSRQAAARGLTATAPSPTGLAFDDADVLVVDYDLLGLVGTGETTGARLAYLARCFSGAGMIIVLNELGSTTTFDLDMDPLPLHFADLHLSAPDLRNAGLWRANWTGYRPWHWPDVTRYVQQLAALKELVSDDPNAPILHALGMPTEGRYDIVPYLPREALEFILPSNQGDPELVRDVTFAEFLEGASGGHKGKDQVSDDDKPRVIASRILTWLERVVLPRQDILVDAPHLVARLPSLLERDSSLKESWDRTATLGPEPVGIQRNDSLDAARFANASYLSRPTWFWPRIAGDESFPDIKSPWTRREPDFVFCEDISRFLPRDEASDFLAGISSPYRRRWVGRVADVTYSPMLNFAL